MPSTFHKKTRNETIHGFLYYIGVNQSIVVTFFKNHICWILDVLYWFRMKQTQMYVCTLCRIYSSRCSHIVVHGWSEDMDWNPHWFIYKCNNRHEKTLRCHYKKRWQFLLAGIVIAQRFDTWDGYSRVLDTLHTYELSDVSTGEFIDTWSLSHSLLAGETVNCCQHVEDLKAIYIYIYIYI